jgi:ABC-type thiamine transport system ATPase subunit
MTELRLTHAFAQGLGPLNAQFSVGLSVVLGASPKDLSSLCELLAGVRPPRHGRVTLDGEELGKRPSARRHVLSLLADEELFARSSVREALSEACALRGSPPAVDAWLARAGVADLGSRCPENLSPDERRAVVLSLALGAEDAALVTLYEPLLLVPRVSERFLIEACRRRAEQAVVVVLTTSIEHALRLGGAVSWLERGRLEGPAEAAPGALHWFTLSVRGGDAEALGGALSQEADVAGVGFDRHRNAAELWVHGADPERLAACIVRHARALGIALDTLRPALPTLESVLLSRAGWTDPNYHAAARAPR